MARPLARLIWGGMLWFMRRPPVKRFRRGFVRFLPESRRAGAWESVRRQDRFARRYGLTVLTISLGISIAIVFFGIAYSLALELYNRGQLSLPAP
ncbi:MAG: hypothetical protein SNJ74_08535 [Fimbriimonadaceae bacterium]